MDPVKAEFKSNGLLEFCSVLVTWKAKGAVQTLQSVFYFSFTFHEFLVSLHVAAPTHPPPQVEWKQGNIYETPSINHVLQRHSFVRKYVMGLIG